MAMNTRSRSTAHKRQSIYVSIHVGVFLDLICKYGLRRKGKLVDQIWAAGMEVVFGRTPAELEECRFSIPNDIHEEKDLHKLTDLLCGVGEE